MTRVSSWVSIVWPAMLILAMMANNSFSVELPNSSDFDRKMKQATNGDASSALWLNRYFEKKGGAENDARFWLFTAAKLGSVVATVELGYEKPYISETDFKCGAYKVHISTSCSQVDKAVGQPICYAQHFEFSLGQEKKDFFLLNPDFRTDLMLATQATCINEDLHYWLVIESSNFGSGTSCLDCEREDYFDETAKYIGSNISKIGMKVVFGYKQVPKALETKLQALMQVNKAIKETLEINRYPVITGEYAK